MPGVVSLLPSRSHSESQQARSGALQVIRAAADPVDPVGALPVAIRDDFNFAQRLISQAVSKSSWSRNAAWIKQYIAYVYDKCPRLIARDGPQEVMADAMVALSFLAHVVRQKPNAHTRVQAARRAINLVRAFAGRPPFDNQLQVRYLAKGAANAVVRTRRQSPALLAIFVANIIQKWGFSETWWERMVALMVVIMTCSLARGAGVTSCLRDGLSWVRRDGTQPAIEDHFHPRQCCDNPLCTVDRCVRGFLLLLPFRKNRRNAPSWIPIAEKSAIKMMANHQKWLRTLPPGRFMFPARKRIRPKAPVGPIRFVPNTSPNSRMSTDTLRTLLRRALVECCGLTLEQAAEFGTHSPRIGAMEELRKCGVPAELRQQLGDWMSERVALTYLQLNPLAQFDILGLI